MKVVFTTMFRETKGGGIGRVAHEIAPAFAFKHETLFIYPGWKTILKKRGKLTRLEIQSEEKNEIAIPILSSKIKFCPGSPNLFQTPHLAYLCLMPIWPTSGYKISRLNK